MENFWINFCKVYEKTRLIAYLEEKLQNVTLSILRASSHTEKVKMKFPSSY
jgi:hypothetical protein